jgi:hypothetical protein
MTFFADVRQFLLGSFNGIADGFWQPHQNWFLVLFAGNTATADC